MRNCFLYAVIASALSLPVAANASCSAARDPVTCKNRTFVAAIMVHIVNTSDATKLQCTSSRGSTWCNDSQGQRFSSTSSSASTFFSGPDGYSGRQGNSGGSILGSDSTGASWRSQVGSGSTFGKDGNGMKWRANTSSGSTFIRRFDDGSMIASCTTSSGSIFCVRPPAGR